MKKQKKQEDITPNTEHLLTLLQIRTDAFIQHSKHIWTVFNWFLTIQVVIGGYYFGIIHSENDNITIPIMGLTISVLWLLLGVKDFQSFKKHKEIKRGVEEIVAIHLGISSVLKYKDKDPINTRKNCEFRQTYILMIFPILVCLLWIYLIITGGF